MVSVLVIFDTYVFLIYLRASVVKFDCELNNFCWLLVIFIYNNLGDKCVEDEHFWMVLLKTVFWSIVRVV